MYGIGLPELIVILLLVVVLAHIFYFLTLRKGKRSGGQLVIVAEPAEIWW
jgi:preprotein translocase subunit YajC